MQVHKLIFSDGFTVCSGSAGPWAIISVELSQSVNEGSALRLGSVGQSVARVAMFAPAQHSLALGMQAQLWRGQRLLGSFTLSQLQRTAPHRLLLTLTDASSALDRELTQWLDSLTGWPYSLAQLAQLAAGQCGLTLDSGDIPNAQLPIDRFQAGIVTGRELLGWCAQLAGCFCRSIGQDTLAFHRYTPSGVTLSPEGEQFYYRDSLWISETPVEDVVGVQLRDPDNTHLLPTYAEDANVYLLEGNPLTAQVEWPHLLVMLGGIPQGYSVGTVQVPDSLALEPGQTVEIFDGSRTVTLLIMELTAKNGRQTLSCLGKARYSLSGISAAARQLAQQLTVARQAVDAQTQQDIFNRLTNNGQSQGVFLEDGQLYINASYLSAGVLDAAVVQVVNLLAERLCSVTEESSLQIDGAQLLLQSGQVETALLSNQYAGKPILYMNDSENGTLTDKCELSPHHFRLGGADPAGVLYLDVTQGQARLDLEGGNPRALSWVYDSTLGRYVLTGE